MGRRPSVRIRPEGRPPRVEDGEGGFEAFPTEALRYGFEGWASIEFDIAADGTTQNIRALAACPPFIFSGAAAGIVRKSLFEASYRPSGGPACSAAQRRIVFSLPSG
jgi:outer membrane biosynthesis protein TonB